MKKQMKRWLALLSAVCVLVSTIVIMASAQNEYLAADQMDFLKTVSADTNLNGSLGGVGGPVWSVTANLITAVAQKPFDGLGMGVELNSTTTIRQDWSSAFTTSQAAEMTLNQEKKAGTTGVMFYLSLPRTNQGDNTVYIQVGDLSKTGSTSNIYAQLNPAQKVYLLSKNTGNWSEATPYNITASYKGLALPDGFEGWVNIPYASFDRAFYYLTRLTLNIKHMGGTGGTVQTGPFYLTTNNLRTKDLAQLDGEVDGDSPVIRHLLTGAVFGREYLAAEQLDLLKTVGADTNLIAGGQVRSVTANLISAVAQKPIDGLGMGVKLDSSTAIRQDWSAGFSTAQSVEINLEQSKKAETATGIMFYLSLPETNLGDNTVFIQMSDTSKTGSPSNIYAMLNPVKDLYLLSGGTGKWSKAQAATIPGAASYKALTLPDGFEGYINIPYASFDRAFYYLSKLSFNIKNMGGAGGTVQAGPFYLTTNNPPANLWPDDLAHLDGEEDGDSPVIRHLLTGEMFGVPPAQPWDGKLTEEIFSTGKDKYGKKSLNIFGDSISFGYNGKSVPEQSYAGLLKKSMGAQFGSVNYGFTSLWTDPTSIREIHALDRGFTTGFTAEFNEAGLGRYNWTCTAETGNLRIVLNRNYNDIDRDINGFHVYYSAGPERGSFQVKVGGNVVSTVDCYAAQADAAARSDYIPLPDGTGEVVTIDLVKVSSSKSVTLCGMNYVNDPDAVYVNNYSSSGQRMSKASEELIRSYCKANVLVLAMGWNDGSYWNEDKAAFISRIDLIISACKQNDTKLVVLDTQWYSTSARDEVSAQLLRAATETSGSYINFKDEYAANHGILDDNVHPTAAGQLVMAEKLCASLGLPDPQTAAQLPPALAANQASALKDTAEGADLLGKLNDGTPVIAEGAGTQNGEITAVAARPIAGINAMGAKLDAAEAYSLNLSTSITTEKQLGLRINRPVLTGATGFMFYVKLPETENPTNTICIQTYDATAVSGQTYQRVKPGAGVYLLEKGSKEWAEKKAGTIGAYGVFDLPNGFEGYINVPFTSMNLPISTFSKMQFNIRSMGGENGSAYVGPFYLTTNDLMTEDMGWLDRETDDGGDPVLRNLFTGKAADAPPPPPPVPPDVLAANQSSALKGAVVGSNLLGGLNEGTPIIAEGLGTQNGQVSAVAVKPLSGLNAVGAKLDASDAYYQDWSGGITTGGQMGLTVGKSTVGATGFMFYLKLPETGNGTNTFWLQLYDPDAGTGKTSQRINPGKPVYVLGKSAREWETVKAANLGVYGVLHLPDGFEGYVNIPFTSMNVTSAYMQKMQFNIQGMGGDGGSACIGPFYFTSNDLRTSYIGWLDQEADDENEPVLRNLFTGRVDVVPAPAEPPVPPRALAAYQSSTLKSAVPGANVAGSLNAGTPIIMEGVGTHNGETKAVAAKPLSGLDAMGAVLSSEEAYFQDWSSGLTSAKQLGLNVGESTEGATGFLFYLKLPETGNETNTFWLQTYDPTAAAGATYQRIKPGAGVYILGRGAEDWKELKTNTLGAYGVLGLPDGFEGYINVPFTSMNLPVHYMQKMQFNIQGLGGENGSAVIGPFYFTTNNLRTMTGGWLDGETDTDGKPVIRDLFIGAVLREEDIINIKLPNPPPILSALPEATLTHSFVYYPISDSSAEFFWYPTSGASAYRLDFYASSLSEDNAIQYTLVSSKTFSENTAILENIEMDTTYYLVLYAADGAASLGLYQVDMVLFDSQYMAVSEITHPTYTDGGNSGDPESEYMDDSEESPHTGDPVPLNLVMGMLLAACCIILITVPARRAGLQDEYPNLERED